MDAMERLDTALLVRMSADMRAALAAYASERGIGEAAAVRELIRPTLIHRARRGR